MRSLMTAYTLWCVSTGLMVSLHTAEGSGSLQSNSLVDSGGWRKRDKVLSRVPFQWRKRDAVPSRVSFQ